MKTLEDCRKAMSQAIARAYGTQVYPVEISLEHGERDVRAFVAKTAGHPHADVTVAHLAALALSRCLKMPADEALASSVADLIDGGVSLDRQAAAPRGLAELMAKHRRTRARVNPLPADLRAKARASAPTVVRRSGESAIRRTAPPPPPAKAEPRVAAGSRVKYRRLDDDSLHELVIGAGPAPAGVRAAPIGSPVAKALLGATKGTIVSVSLGPALVDLEVLDVR